MDDIQAREWAFLQFGTAKLGDLRNQKRLLKIAATVVRSGGGTISKVMTDPREREAAYDFVENERISAEAVGHAAAVATARQLAREPFVWLAVDGSSLSFPDFPMPVLKRSQGRVRVVARSLTIGQAVTHIAEIGGYTGKSSGGPPGSTTIGRGLERVQLVAEGMKLADEARVTSWNKRVNFCRSPRHHQPHGSPKSNTKGSPARAVGDKGIHKNGPPT